jgi:hypothetical protein
MGASTIETVPGASARRCIARLPRMTWQDAAMRTAALSLSILAAACGGTSPAARPGAGGAAAGDGNAAAELSPALAPLAWWLGTWEAEDGASTEHWIAAAGAIYGVSLQGPRSFEVMIARCSPAPDRPPR